MFQNRYVIRICHKYVFSGATMNVKYNIWELIQNENFHKKL